MGARAPWQKSVRQSSRPSVPVHWILTPLLKCVSRSRSGKRLRKCSNRIQPVIGYQRSGHSQPIVSHHIPSRPSFIARRTQLAAHPIMSSPNSHRNQAPPGRPSTSVILATGSAAFPLEPPTVEDVNGAPSIFKRMACMTDANARDVQYDPVGEMHGFGFTDSLLGKIAFPTDSKVYFHVVASFCAITSHNSVATNSFIAPLSMSCPQ